MSKRLLGLLCALVACVVFVGACGGDDAEESSGGGAAAGGEKTNQTEGAKVIDPASMQNASGTVTYCSGKDTSGAIRGWIEKFNAQNNGVTVKFNEFPASADEQRNQFIQRQQAKSGECDVFSSDVIWTAEFASQKWLYDMTPYIESRRQEFIQAPIETVTFEDKVWGVPESTDAAFIYYNTDKVDAAPTTWQQVYSQAQQNGGIVFQGAPYEGLTCDFLEIAFAAGGTVVSEDGTQATINSPENVRALTAMADVVKNGGAPKAVTTYMEPESLTAWQTGEYAFMRNWPYAYALSQKANKIKGKFEVAPLPSFEGGGRAGILGGHNSVVSAYSKNPGAALKVIDYISGEENQVDFASEYSLAPVLNATYEDASVKEALPFSAELKQAVSQAKARPVSPVYPQISQAIYKNVNLALSGQATPEEAMKQAQADIEQALATF